MRLPCKCRVGVGVGDLRVKGPLTFFPFPFFEIPSIRGVSGKDNALKEFLSYAATDLERRVALGVDSGSAKG